MTDERRQQLEAQLVADTTTDGGSPAPRIKALCALATSELAVSGTGATVLSEFDDDGQSPRRGLIHATNAISSGLEDLQLTVGEGPCLDTFSTGGPVLIAELQQASERWPAFTPAALDLGAVAVFSFPLQIGVVRLGSLDLYRDTDGSLSDAQLSDALIVADLMTQAVIAELEGHSTDDVSWLANPHAQIHQASGMVQVQLQTTTEAALLHLRAHAYSHELSITEVARRVVARELRFPAET
ncbi:hypothetical protein FHX42_004461 [Saccharopolyspora lacisalsi]|uniref:ANTAR domain-containing protein n=1 Tax=Halosaccharopolyspora lacisalsi TaxID=1000566 RepID=A0A839E5S5_9PSEU|nr:GAF and ANTAR domain-containing protein [Halosaccharopolyspora lacisalsi]MBA8827077.1 hypothetical protein [Halosaccharopolyspora lacisalsi]